MRLIGFLGTLLLASLLHAAPPGNPLDIELVSEQRSIGAGAAFCLGLHLRHPAGFHTYWKHPGIVGLATQVEWDLPAGFVAGEIQWPAPEVVKMASYDAQGYQGETMLLIPLRAAPDLSAKTVTLTAKVSWMCCGTTCSPALKIPFTLTLPVAASASADPAAEPLFAHFRAQLPQADPAWQTAVTREQNSIILTLQAPAGKQPVPTVEGIRFFTADGQVDSNQEQQVAILSDGRIRLRLALSEFTPPHPATLPGVVAFPVGWHNADAPFHLEVNPKYAIPAPGSAL